VNDQVAARGLVLKQGTLIDATLIDEADVAPKNMRRGDRHAGGRPLRPGGQGEARREPAATARPT
jgi:hypothetical protein